MEEPKLHAAVVQWGDRALPEIQVQYVGGSGVVQFAEQHELGEVVHDVIGTRPLPVDQVGLNEVNQ